MKSQIDSFMGNYFFLSNFYLHPVSYNGRTYPSSEHAYQAAKITPSAEEEFNIHAIQTAASPAIAKKLGRQVNIRSDWEDVKVYVMREILNDKFSDPDLADRLLGTGDAELIEGNWWGDRVWGCVKDEDGEWAGKNLLGKLLMEIRSEKRLDINRKTVIQDQAQKQAATNNET